MGECGLFQKTVEDQIELLKEARQKLVKRLFEKAKGNQNFDLEVKSRGGMGIRNESTKNDRRMYAWIECHYNDKEYDINLFHSEVDKDSGNCHCQIGKLMFTKDYVKNKSSVTSPNEILEGNAKSTTLIINSYKWKNPLDYFKSEYSPLNGLYISVDDILKSDELTGNVVDAFFSFIKDDK